MRNLYLSFEKEKTVAIKEELLDLTTLGTEEVAGKTVCSMISAGTEINAYYLNAFHWPYPMRGGYAVIFQVEHIGKNVTGICVGDLVFTMGVHQSYQIANYHHVVKLPENILPQHALFARLAGVSLASVRKSSVTPGENVLITGLGNVGFMAMQAFSNLGYYVIGVDPDPHRRSIVKDFGFSEVYETVPFEKYNKKIGLALECSGNESAALDCCKILRFHGELSLVGAPWKPCSDKTIHELTYHIFYNLLTVYSGWETDLAIEESKFVHESRNKNLRMVMGMIADGRIRLDERLYTIRPYTEAQQVYDAIYEKREKAMAVIFSWD